MDVDTAALTAGPRGRRLCLEYACTAFRDDVAGAVMRAAYLLDPGRGASRVMTSSSGDGPALATDVPSPADVAALLARRPLPPVGARELLGVLADAVDSAMYWQEPDGEDILAAAPEMGDAIAGVAAHIAASEHVRWWTAPVALPGQETVRREYEGPEPGGDPAGELARWRAATLRDEARIRAERPRDPDVAWNGEWWSTPPQTLTGTTRRLGAYGPAGLWLVEDGIGPEHATTRAVAVPAGARVYEIDGPAAWAALCRAYPLDVTAARDDDWSRVTGRSGAWTIPDWSRVAVAYDAVHLTVAGYLAAAGTPIAVDDTAAGVIAGWNPDETYWLTSVPASASAAETWALDDDLGWIATA
jgi:hypothetical protein